MAQIYNTDLSKELIQGASIQVNRDLVPNQLAEKVVPVMEVNPKMFRLTSIAKYGTCLNASSATIFTAATAGVDTYLTGFALSVIKDVTATSISSSITCVVGGETKYPIAIAGFSLTVQDQTLSIQLTNPIKIDRGSAVNVTCSTNVGNVKAIGIINGYIVENLIN